MTLFALPLDALACIASYNDDWNTVACTCTAGRTATQTVHKRLVQHALYCARQVASTTSPNDAVALAALYLRAGVPLYPSCLGYAMASMEWRIWQEHGGGAEEDEEGTDGTERSLVLPYMPNQLPPLTYVQCRALVQQQQQQQEEPQEDVDNNNDPITIHVHEHLYQEHLKQHYVRLEYSDLIQNVTRLEYSDLVPSPPVRLAGDLHVRLPPPDYATNNDDNDDLATSWNFLHTAAPVLPSFTVTTYTAASQHWSTVFGNYQRKMEAILDTHTSLSALDELWCDLWDEVWPSTAYVHYYTGRTAVPRNLSHFLSTPCPIRASTMQCEIERIKISSGLFSVYEYRLFVRHDVPEDATRYDTVLLVARPVKRKDRCNNYILRLPTQEDVDAHFNAVNATTTTTNATNVPNGALQATNEQDEDESLGRLQSNFVGTEFQIFVPTKKNSNNKKVPPKRSNSMTPSTVPPASSPSLTDSNNKRRFRLLRRTKAIADESSATATTPSEQEDGVITYTANLLGSRPRLMDVCVPKLDGSYDSTNDEEDGMLASFRHVLHRLDELDEGQNPEDDDNDDANQAGGGRLIEDDAGLLVLQNRPPWWNMELGSFVLNFGGRVSVASVKNFQLCDRYDQQRILLQFGRTGRHSFTMDYQYPLSAVQAFSMAVSSLQSKISFG